MFTQRVTWPTWKRACPGVLDKMNSVDHQGCKYQGTPYAMEPSPTEKTLIVVSLMHARLVKPTCLPRFHTLSRCRGQWPQKWSGTPWRNLHRPRIRNPRMAKSPTSPSKPRAFRSPWRLWLRVLACERTMVHFNLQGDWDLLTQHGHCRRGPRLGCQVQVNGQMAVTVPDGLRVQVETAHPGWTIWDSEDVYIGPTWAKSRLVSCVSFASWSEQSTTTTNLDAPLLRPMLSLAASEVAACSSVDIASAFLDADIHNEDIVLVTSQPILVKMNVVKPNTVWQVMSEEGHLWPPRGTTTLARRMRPTIARATTSLTWYRVTYIQACGSLWRAQSPKDAWFRLLVILWEVSSGRTSFVTMRYWDTLESMWMIYSLQASAPWMMPSRKLFKKYGRQHLGPDPDCVPMNLERIAANVGSSSLHQQKPGSAWGDTIGVAHPWRDPWQGIFVPG